MRCGGGIWSNVRPLTVPYNTSYISCAEIGASPMSLRASATASAVSLARWASRSPKSIVTAAFGSPAFSRASATAGPAAFAIPSRYSVRSPIFRSKAGDPHVAMLDRMGKSTPPRSKPSDTIKVEVAMKRSKASRAFSSTAAVRASAQVSTPKIAAAAARDAGMAAVANVMRAGLDCKDPIPSKMTAVMNVKAEAIRTTALITAFKRCPGTEAPLVVVPQL